MYSVGYARSSSSDNSLEIQIDKLNEARCDKIYQEKVEGKDSERTGFDDCMRYLRKGDKLIITSLERLSRSAYELVQIRERFENEGIELIVLDQNVGNNTSSGRLLFNILASIAEYEYDCRD